MVLNITFSPDTEQGFRERAEAHGEDVASYTARLLCEVVASPKHRGFAGPFAERSTRGGMPGRASLTISIATCVTKPFMTERRTRPPGLSILAVHDGMLSFSHGCSGRGRFPGARQGGANMAVACWSRPLSEPDAFVVIQIGPMSGSSLGFKAERGLVAVPMPHPDVGLGRTGG